MTGEKRISRVRSLISSTVAFLTSTLFVAIVASLLTSRGLFEPSPTVLVLAASMAFGIWLFIPRQWLTFRRLSSAYLLIVCGTCGIVGYSCLRNHHVEQTVQTCVALGGRVDFDYQWTVKSFFKTRNGWILPTFLRELLGDCVFADVSHAWLFISSDDELSQLDLTPIIDVTTVHMGGSVTDEALLELSQYNRTKSLTIAGRNITDAGIAHVSRLKSLERLEIQDANMTGACIEDLKQLKGLKDLIVFETRLGPIDVLEIKNALPACRVRWHYQLR